MCYTTNLPQTCASVFFDMQLACCMAISALGVYDGGFVLTFQLFNLWRCRTPSSRVCASHSR